MDAFIHFLEIAVSVLAVVVTVMFLYQPLYLVIPLLFHRKKPQGEAPKRRFAILIAARNEEAVLPHLLDSIKAQDYPEALITTYVVADNCTDKTAKLAREHGAVVFERFNKVQVGKGYALDYLLTQLKEQGLLENHDAFMIFDADNLLLPNYFTEMNKTCAQGYDAFCGYRNTKNFGTNWISAGYGIWYLHDSTHLNQSRSIIGANCAVNGTGFGFTRELLERMGGWKFFTLTEDIEFSAVSAARGYRIGYCHDAILFDEQPTRWKQSYRQRIRWSQGGIQVSFKHFKEFFKGMSHLRTLYSSFEMFTLSFWGMAVGVTAGVLGLLLVFLEMGFVALLNAIGIALLTTYLTTAGMAALTVATEWKRIAAPTRWKLLSILCFPIFMITWAPIAVLAGFYKFQWTPIDHTAAVSVTELTGTKKSRKKPYPIRGTPQSVKEPPVFAWQKPGGWLYRR